MTDKDIERSIAIDTIASRRAEMAIEGELVFEGWMDAAEINGIAEDFGGTYSEAWNDVRRAYKQHLVRWALTKGKIDVIMYT